MDVDAWVESFLHTMGAIYNDDKVIILSYIMQTLVNILYVLKIFKIFH